MKLQFNITPRILQALPDSDTRLLTDAYIERQGVYMIGYAHKCEAETRTCGAEQYHAVVEFWDVRDPGKPFFISVLHPENQKTENGHYTLPEAAVAVADLVSQFQDISSLPDEAPGSLLIALIRADVKAELVRSSMAGFVQALSALVEDADDDDDDDTPLPGVFADFNPFGE